MPLSGPHLILEPAPRPLPSPSLSDFEATMSRDSLVKPSSQPSGGACVTVPGEGAVAGKRDRIAVPKGEGHLTSDKP